AGEELLGVEVKHHHQDPKPRHHGQHHGGNGALIIPHQKAAHAHAQKSEGHRHLKGSVLPCIASTHPHGHHQEDHEQGRPHEGQCCQHIVQHDLGVELAHSGVDIKAIDENHNHFYHGG